MILWLLVLFTILTFVSFMLIPKKGLRIMVGSFFTLCLLACAIGTSAHLKSHWGMEKKTVTTSQKIYTAGDTKAAAKMLLVKEVGTKSANYVVMYRTTPTQKKASAHFVPDQKHMVEAVKKTATYQETATNEAVVTTKKTYWVWQSKTFKTLFNLEGHNQELIKSQATVTVPKDTWVVLTAAQAKIVAQKQKNSSASELATQQTQMKQILAKEVATYKAQHPTASSADLAAYTQNQTAVLAVQAVKQMLNR